jgi:alpha-ribazole phosphatase
VRHIGGPGVDVRARNRIPVAHFPVAEIDAWAADMAHYRPGGGESVFLMAARVRAWHAHLLRHAQAHAIEHAIVVCHAGTMRLLSACHAGLSLPDMALHAASTPHKIGYGATIVLDG